MVIAKPLEFRWTIKADRVLFSVKEPYEHRLVCFLNTYCEKNAKMPSLPEWLQFYKKVGAPESKIKEKIKIFNKNKKNENKLNLEFDKIYSKVPIAGKAKKVVKKKT